MEQAVSGFIGGASTVQLGLRDKLCAHRQSLTPGTLRGIVDERCSLSGAALRFGWGIVLRVLRITLHPVVRQK